jgi:heterodisulfide reductase subunit B
MHTTRYLYYQGCQIEPGLPHYDRSIRAVMAALDIELVDWEWNCCGYPMRSQDLVASVLAAARNLAVAAREGLTLMTPCKCCYGQLRHADYWMRKKQGLRRHVNGILAPEGLTWEPGISVRHLLQVLVAASDQGALRGRIRRPLQGIRIAAHYGCHALRPGEVVQFDNPRAPTLFEKLVAATGATAVDWPLRLECCGYPLQDRNVHLAQKLMARKIDDARQAGAQLMATACTYCQMQFEGARRWQGHESGHHLPAVLYSQILGRALDLPIDELGLSANLMQIGL